MGTQEVDRYPNLSSKMLFVIGATFDVHLISS
jgi:hypothetical protein